MHRVTMTNEEAVPPEPIGGRGLAETEHLHLEKGPLGADEVLEGFEDGQVESFGVDLDEAKPWDEVGVLRSEEHTSELQSQSNLVCRLLLEKKKKRELLLDPNRQNE